MILNPFNINARGKLTHLVSADLFYAGCRQVFNAKSGKYLGLVMPFQEIDFQDTEEVETMEPEQDNKNQLTLF